MTNPAPRRFLHEEFQKFCLACFGDISEGQYTDLRRTFMGGAAAVFGFLMREIEPGEEPSEADLALVRSLQDELLDFNEAVKRGEK